MHCIDHLFIKKIASLSGSKLTLTVVNANKMDCVNISGSISLRQWFQVTLSREWKIFRPRLSLACREECDPSVHPEEGERDGSEKR